jgi:hypothetical protein
MLSCRNRPYYQSFGDRYCLHLQGDFAMSRTNTIQYSVHYNIAQKDTERIYDTRFILHASALADSRRKDNASSSYLLLSPLSPYIISYHYFVFELSRYRDALQAGGPGFDSQQGQNCSLLHSVQTDSGAHPASYTIGIGGSFPAGKAAGAWRWPVTFI